MAYGAKVLADSLSPSGVRLTTMEVTIPRLVLAEFNTHRMFSRNSASSRAIPVEKRIQSVLGDPFVPDAFGKNKSGMQASEDLDETNTKLAREVWRLAKEDACFHANRLAKMGVHKQLANRLIEPFCWQTIIVTATEYDNFFALRRDSMAQPEIQKPAELMYVAMQESNPRQLKHGEWHLPLLQPDELVVTDDSSEHDEQVVDGRTMLELSTAIKVSIGRCARVSYLTHEGKRDISADVALYDRLVSSGHMSPTEHVARPMTRDDAYLILRKQGPVSCDLSDIDVRDVFSGNFRGWMSHRKMIPGESVFVPAQQPG